MLNYKTKEQLFELYPLLETIWEMKVIPVLSNEGAIYYAQSLVVTEIDGNDKPLALAVHKESKDGVELSVIYLVRKEKGGFSTHVLDGADDSLPNPELVIKHLMGSLVEV